jgi:hypothetical protein
MYLLPNCELNSRQLTLFNCAWQCGQIGTMSFLSSQGIMAPSFSANSISYTDRAMKRSETPRRDADRLLANLKISRLA